MKRNELKALGLTPEQIDAVMETNGDDIENAKTKMEEKKDKEIAALNDKLSKVDSKPTDKSTDHEAELGKLKKELDDMKAGKNDPAPQTDDKKSDDDELAKARKELEDYKASVEAEKIAKAKSTLLSKSLKEKGANPKLIDLIAKEFDLSKVELDGDGDAQTIKGFDGMLKPVQEKYADFFGKTEEKAADVANPGKGNDSSPEPKNLNEALRQKFEKK